jgi:hypothetical protein
LHTLQIRFYVVTAELPARPSLAGPDESEADFSTGHKGAQRFFVDVEQRCDLGRRG